MKNRIKKTVIPFRHAEWGANNNNYFIAGYGFGTPIVVAATSQGMDRLGIAQYLTNIGLIISHNDPVILDEAKEQWLNDPMWQGLRRIVEDSFVTKDWFELHVLQNFLIDGVFHPLLFQHLENDVVKSSGAAFAMLTEFFADWFAESQRWTDNTIKVAVSESDENKTLIKGWMNLWKPQVLAAAKLVADFAFGDRSEDVMQQILSKLDVRLKLLGVNV